MIKPMLCHDFEVNGAVLKENGLDGDKVTAAYRKAVAEGLPNLMVRGFVAERKGRNCGGAFIAEYPPVRANRIRALHCPRKWDGTRVLAINLDGSVVLQNRNGVIYTVRLPEIAKALKTIKGRWILDSEVIYLDPNTGEELFTPCQRRCATQFPDWMLRDQFPVKMETFDLLQINGESLERRTYFERKDLLYKLLAVNNEDPALEYVSYDSDLLKAWTEAVQKNREGLIAKSLSSPYEHDRSYQWLKVKNWRFMCCDIVGFTAGENARSPFFGSLVLAKDGKYIGCAGSGFNDWELRKFKDLFSDAPRIPQPFSYTQVGEPYTAIKMNVQVLVKFYQVTDNDVLRFPIFITSN